MAKHMGIDDRKRIEFLLDCGKGIAEIARDIGRPESTVSREIQPRRIDSDKRYGCSNRLCSRFDECELKQHTATSAALRKNAPKCFKRCPRFFEAACERRAKAPYACNGCERLPCCPLKRKFYRAAGAQGNYDSLLRNSRLGVHPDQETFAKMDAVISPCIKKGQSVRNVVANNPDVFKGFKVRTVHQRVAGGLFSAKRHDLPYACGRKPRPKKAETKTNAKCRVGRTVREMREWLKENPGVVPCEIDTVIGSISGKVLFTTIFPETGLALAFHRDAKTSQTCTRIFNMPWEIARPDLFRKLFAGTLGDNGVEFSDPVMIERCRPDPEHNPTKLLPHGIRFWYADPCCSTQKPHVERVHEEIRRVLEGHELQLARPGRRQPHHVARQQLHEALAREPHPDRPLRREVRRRRQEVPRRARHPQDPREPGHAAPVPAGREVPAPRGQGHAQKNGVTPPKKL